MKTITLNIIVALSLVMVGCTQSGPGVSRDEVPCQLESPGSWELDPKVIQKVEAGYPEMAKRAGLKGIVCVAVFLSSSGEVLQAEILRSAHPILDRQALIAARKTVFQPAVAAGEPVASRMVLEFSFKGDNSAP